ncbi:hypothetical protein EST38_g14575 [Candolleomyces aberdarensis]|uniref:Uncharacterized protein n=1 Tax=Candolleomyces aberdarensis TaxID=2316362 RepID=A0A4Q2CWX7_9AGAR|nr:hypothetical protein EST38_g14575 [Candolleomyces aberdarensis]
MLEPSGLEVVEPTRKLMPYVQVPPLRTKPIQGGRKLAPEQTPAEVPAGRSAQALKQARKELIMGIIKEILSVPHPMKLEDLAMVSPLARQEAIDLLKKGKWDRSKSGTAEELKGALLQELEDTMADLGQDSLSYLNVLAEIYSQVDAASPKAEEQLTPPLSQRATVEDVPEEEEKITEEMVEVLLQDLPVPMCYESDGSGEVPAGGLIIPDAVEVFLAEHSRAEVKGMVTASESEKIRVSFPIINHARREESIFDEGSQVCSASEAVARTLGISWDPDLTIGLQSSNRTTARTLGLARNVPIQCGDGVTAYVQLHIVRDAAYKILLGRPFLSVMSAQSHNHLDGSHTMTLADPNSGRRVVVPSFPRGEIPELYRDELNTSFRTSRI